MEYIPIPKSLNSELILRFGVQRIDAGKWSLYQKRSFNIFIHSIGENVEANDYVAHGEALRNGYRRSRLDAKDTIKS